MTKQTIAMRKSMPQLSKLLEDYDARGHDWIIVSWRNILPWQVTLSQIVPVPAVKHASMPTTNIFPSRTKALRISEEICHHITNRSQDEHWGVWTWQNADGQHYQSVLPAVAFEAKQNHDA